MFNEIIGKQDIFIPHKVLLMRRFEKLIHNFHIVIPKNDFSFLLKNNPDFNWPKNGEMDIYNFMLSFAMITQNDLDILPECMERTC